MIFDAVSVGKIVIVVLVGHVLPTCLCVFTVDMSCQTGRDIAGTIMTAAWWLQI